MIYNIFKRTKPIMPEPKFDDNWKQERFEQNVKQGVAALQNGKMINIMDDGRGFELALEIKNRFIMEYVKQLSERIKIEHGAGITIKITNN